MLENLRIALRKQRKLILIFFLTIFLPALTLSVFDVRAIRNERFRLAKQEENEGRRAADASLAASVRRAEALEFIDKNFRASAALYRELYTISSGRNLKAEMLTGQARCLQKGEDYGEAAGLYARVASEYSDCLTPSRLPLGILTRLQSIECYKRTGDSQQAAKHGLELFRELLKKPSALSEDQFKTYLSLAGEALDSVLAEVKGGQVSEEIRQEYADLKKLQADRMKEWTAAGLLRKEIIPELAGTLSQSGGQSSKPYRFSKNVEGRDLLLLASRIPDRDGREIAGMLGVQLNSEYLVETVLPEAIGNAQLNEGTEVILADLAGRPLSGKGDISTALPLAAEYFEDNFPPWKIELFQAPAKGLEALDLRRNFYFWTILTLIVVLAFGAFLIVRTIGHEMEILKIKSDFVSSVSHEFKTPLTRSMFRAALRVHS